MNLDHPFYCISGLFQFYVADQFKIVPRLAFSLLLNTCLSPSPVFFPHSLILSRLFICCKCHFTKSSPSFVCLLNLQTTAQYPINLIMKSSLSMYCCIIHPFPSLNFFFSNNTHCLLYKLQGNMEIKLFFHQLSMILLPTIYIGTNLLHPFDLPILLWNIE